MSSIEEYRKQKQLPANANVSMVCVTVNQENSLLAMRFKFDGDFLIGGVPLLLNPDAPTKPTLETGHRVWDCGIILAKFIEKALGGPECKGLRVIELGCGAGVAGFAAALKGMAVTLTDTAAMGERAAAHIELNGEAVARRGGSIRFKVLDWRRLNEWEGNEAFDLVLASDCVWHTSLLEKFTRALLWACARNPSCRILFAHKIREPALGEPLFKHLERSGFEARRMPRGDLDASAKADVWELLFKGRS